MARPQAAPPEAANAEPARSDAQPEQPRNDSAGQQVPVPLHLSELKSHHVTQLVEMAVANGIENASRLRKQDLIFALLKNQAKKGASIYGDGTLEVLPDGFGFLRSPETSYLASTDDIYVSPSQIRRFNLHTGDSIEGEIRTPKDGERRTRSSSRTSRRCIRTSCSSWSATSRPRRTSPGASSTSSPRWAGASAA
jgi:hypothetical protein